MDLWDKANAVTRKPSNDCEIVPKTDHESALLFQTH